MARSLARNTKVFASTLVMDTSGGGTLFNQANADTTNTWEIKVLDGYSFSQDATSQEIGVNEAGTTPVRGTLAFNTALNPVDVSISTYVRSYPDPNDSNKTTCVELPLWVSAMGTDMTIGATKCIEAQTAGSMTLGLKQSNTNQLMSLTLFFVLENTTYVVEDFNVSGAEVDFSIDGIATINWTGFGSRVNENQQVHEWLREGGTFVSGTDYKAVPATTTNTFLRNKLSTVELIDNTTDTPIMNDTVVSLVSGQTLTVGDMAGLTAAQVADLVGGRAYNVTEAAWATIVSVVQGSDTITIAAADDVSTWSGDTLDLFGASQNAGTIYNMAITGATLTLENNFSYLTPEELAIVNLPLAGFAGNRVTSGSLTAYLNTGATGTGGLLQDLLAKIEESVTTDYTLKFHMGGGTSDVPRVDFIMPHANISVPTTNVEDIISTEISFTAKPWDDTLGAGSFEDTNELTIEYKSA